MSDFEKNVFINCPYDEAYSLLLRPMVFTILYFGLNPLLTLDDQDGSKNRIDKITSMIKNSKYGIHDLSRYKPSNKSKHFRMNMPFEFGIDIGYKYSTLRGRLSRKKMLLVEEKQYSLDVAFSDSKGLDPVHHDKNPQKIVRIVRNWIVNECETANRFDFMEVWNMYNDSYRFVCDKVLRRKKRKDMELLSIHEYIGYVNSWLASR